MNEQTSKNELTFTELVNTIRDVDFKLSTHAKNAINIGLTLRNWIIGYNIAEFELHGLDRARYGDKLLNVLSCKLQDLGVSNAGRRQLYNYLSLYRTFPEIMQTLPLQYNSLIPTAPALDEKVPTVSAQFGIPPEIILTRLSYSHLKSIVGLKDRLKMAFYVIECMKGNWSVRELNRQIGSLFYERSGLSTNKTKLSEQSHEEVGISEPEHTIRDPYVFEFLGLKRKEVMGESDLENALLDKVQEFLLEMGHGFCFEIRQKRILIGEKHYFVDLVFYHRILKCHILIELKAEEFSHGHLGQLNTYVNWYRENEMTGGDNPPVGILLCTQKDHPLVRYALAGMDNQLFVSKYQLELPKMEEISEFLKQQLKMERKRLEVGTD